MTQPQFWTIRSVKKGRPYKTNYGRFHQYAMALEGFGEPVKLSLSEPVVREPEVGGRIYGKMTEEIVNDRTYFQLQVVPLTVDQQRQIDIHAQVGVKEAIGIYLAGDYRTVEERAAAYENIQTEAIHIAKMIDNVKKEL